MRNPLISGLCALLLTGLPMLASTPGVYAIRGGRVHTLEGPVLEKGTIVIRAGRIAAVGADIAIPADAELIDATGLEVVPGFFDALSQMGLKEIDAVRATVDTTELGGINPQLVAATAVHPASALIPVARAAGITQALSIPGLDGGPTLPGQASVIRLQGRVLAEMSVTPSVAMVLNWPVVETRSFDLMTFKMVNKPYAEAKKEQEKKLQDLTEQLGRARHYALAMEKGQVADYERDLRLEALVPVVQGRQIGRAHV